MLDLDGHHTPIHEGGGASRRLHTGGAGAEGARPTCVDSFMDECVAVAVAEAVAVTEAVAEADQSIHDQSIHDPSIYKEIGLKPRNMKNRFFKKSSQKDVYTDHFC